MRKIPKWVYSVGIRVFVGFWLLYGVMQIWIRVEEMRRPISHPAPTVSQLAALATAIETYTHDNGAPPTREQGLDALIRPPKRPPLAANWDGPYLSETQSIPADEWGRPYRYTSPGPSGEPFEVMSYGKDGKPGGTGEDEDLSRSVSFSEPAVETKSQPGNVTSGE